MVDVTKLTDMGGDDVIVNNIRTATGPGQIGVKTVYSTTAGVTTISTTTSTLTYAAMNTGFVLTTNAGATTLTFDTAANIITAMSATGSGVAIGDKIMFTVGCQGAGGVTVALASGVTNPNAVSLTVAAGIQRDFLLVVTGVTTPAITVIA